MLHRKTFLRTHTKRGLLKINMGGLWFRKVWKSAKGLSEAILRMHLGTNSHLKMFVVNIALFGQFQVVLIRNHPRAPFPFYLVPVSGAWLMMQKLIKEKLLFVKRWNIAEQFEFLNTDNNTMIIDIMYTNFIYNINWVW